MDEYGTLELVNYEVTEVFRDSKGKSNSYMAEMTFRTLIDCSWNWLEHVSWRLDNFAEMAKANNNSHKQEKQKK
jgi:hypothetical protein